MVVRIKSISAVLTHSNKNKKNRESGQKNRMLIFSERHWGGIFGPLESPPIHPKHQNNNIFFAFSIINPVQAPDRPGPLRGGPPPPRDRPPTNLFRKTFPWKTAKMAARKPGMTCAASALGGFHMHGFLGHWLEASQRSVITVKRNRRPTLEHLARQQ